MALRFQHYTLDAVTWTAIRAPIKSNAFTLQDYDLSTAILLRTDKDDSTTQTRIPSGMQGKVLNQPTTSSPGNHTNFEKDEIVIYAQSESGTITAVAGFL